MIDTAIVAGEYLAYSVASDAMNKVLNVTWKKTVEPLSNQIPNVENIPTPLAAMPKSIIKRSTKRYFLKKGLPVAMTAITQALPKSLTSAATTAASAIASNPLLVGATCGVLAAGVIAYTTYTLLKTKKSTAQKLAQKNKQNQSKTRSEEKLHSIKNSWKKSTRYTDNQSAFKKTLYNKKVYSPESVENSSLFTITNKTEVMEI